MSKMRDFTLTVVRTINLGNYESIKLEASGTIESDDTADTPDKMKKQLLREVQTLLDDAFEDFMPTRRNVRD